MQLMDKNKAREIQNNKNSSSLFAKKILQGIKFAYLLLNRAIGIGKLLSRKEPFQCRKARYGRYQKGQQYKSSNNTVPTIKKIKLKSFVSAGFKIENSDGYTLER